MSRAIHRFPGQFPPDSGDARAMFLLSGGADEVKEAAKRRNGRQYKALVVITCLSILLGVVWYGFNVSLVCGLSVGLAGLLAVAIGSAIFSLAQASLSGQLKEGKAVDAADATSQFETKELYISLRLFNMLVSALFCLLRSVFLMAMQRLFDGLSGVVHIALSRRVLPIPFCPR